MTELRKAWTDTLRPAWKTAVLAGSVRDLTGAAHEFEKHLLELEDEGRNLLLARGGDDTPVLNEIYWASGYAEPATLEPVKAAAVARWGTERRARIMAWGKNAADAQVRAAAERIGPGPVFTEEPLRPLNRKTAVERVLFYRRVLAAWEFLLAMDAQLALTELRTLIELERLPLPARSRAASTTPPPASISNGLASRSRAPRSALPARLRTTSPATCRGAPVGASVSRASGSISG